MNGKLEEEKLDQLIKPRGRATLALDASSLVGRLSSEVPESFDAEEPYIKPLGFSVQHSVEVLAPTILCLNFTDRPSI